MHVTVYSLPSSVCHSCKFTKRKLEQFGIPFTVVRLDHDKGALEKVKSLGYTSAPVVHVDLGDGATWTWHGYAPSQIERLAQEITTGEEVAA